MSTKPSKKQLQANRLSRKINQLLDSGEFTLQHGKYVVNKDCGCAIFAAASASGACDPVGQAKRAEDDAHTSLAGKRLRTKLIEWGLDLRDVMALEIGFETTINDFDDGVPAILKANPFYRLGVRLQSRAEENRGTFYFEDNCLDVVRRGVKSPEAAHWLPEEV